ncbi:hypothetical protein V8E51_013983 [Hyaloscypha variabilis]|jgi:hypothetical protein
MLAITSCSQPSRCSVLDDACSKCRHSRPERRPSPLPLEERERRKAKFLTLQAQAEQYLLELDQHNKPLEEELCNVTPEFLTLVQIRQLHTLYYQLHHHLLSREQCQTGPRLKQLEKVILGVPPALLEELSLDERFDHVEILRGRFTFDCSVYRRRYDRREEYADHFSDLEALKAKMLAFMAQIRVQTKVLSEIVLLEKSESRDPEDGGSELENATPTDGILPFELRLKLLIERYAYSKRTWRKALERSPGEPWDDWHNGYETASGDTMTDEFFERYIEAGVLECVSPKQDRVSRALASVPIEDLLENDRQCSICREAYGQYEQDAKEGENPVRLQCGHTFGNQCITRWLLEKRLANCPVCRREALPSLPED